MQYILRSTFLFQQINPNSEESSSTSQKRVAISVNAGDSMSEPRGKVCKSNIIDMSMRGTLRTYEGNHSCYFSGADMIEEEPRLDRSAATEYHHLFFNLNQNVLKNRRKMNNNYRHLPIQLQGKENSGTNYGGLKIK